MKHQPLRFRIKAKSLHIQVTEAAETQIDLTFCASLTEHLPRLLPKAVRAKLQKQAINVARITAHAQKQEYDPGELFSFMEGARVLRVWLE
jgi:hypothetical protein